MEIRKLDVHDEALGDWYDVVDQADRHGRPHATSWSRAEFVATARSEPPDERMVPIAAYDDDAVVGGAMGFVPLLDNLDKLYFMLAVAPDRRREGIGSALLEAIVDLAREEDRTLLLGESRLPMDADADHPHERFARSHGFRQGNVELERILPLPLAEEQIDAWATEAAEHHEGYRIESFVGAVPAHLRESLVALKNQLAVDAPTGEIDFEEHRSTVELYDEQQRQHAERGREMFETLAIWTDGEGREQTVAQTTIACPPGEDDLPNLHQWGTFVHRGHRGRRLGLAVKVANLRAVQQAHPERTTVHTQNSPENAPMVAVNEQLGFRPVEAAVEFIRTL